MTALLRSEGHTVEFVKTPDRDDVELVVHGETIYCCKIQDLQYGKSEQNVACVASDSVVVFRVKLETGAGNFGPHLVGNCHDTLVSL